MTPKQIRADLFFLAAQYKKNKQGRAIAGTEDVLDAAIQSMRELENQNARMQEIISNQRHYTRHLHALYKYCKDTLEQHGLLDRKAMAACCQQHQKEESHEQV